MRVVRGAKFVSSDILKGERRVEVKEEEERQGEGRRENIKILFSFISWHLKFKKSCSGIFPPADSVLSE